MGNPTGHSIVTGFQKTTDGAPYQAQLDDSLNLKVNVVAGGAGGGAMTVADGADVAQGATNDSAWVSGAGTVISLLKKIASAGGSAVSIANGSDVAEGSVGDAAWVSGNGTVISLLKKIASGGGGSAVTIADGADSAEGTTTDAAVVTDVAGTISGKLRGLIKILASVWDSTAGRLNVAQVGIARTAVGILTNNNDTLTIDTTGMATVTIYNTNTTGGFDGSVFVAASQDGGTNYSSIYQVNVYNGYGNTLSSIPNALTGSAIFPCAGYDTVKITLFGRTTGTGTYKMQASPAPWAFPHNITTIQGTSGNAVDVGGGALSVNLASSGITLGTNVAQFGGTSVSIGQQLAAASIPVILPSATVTTLTPPAAITGFALDSTLTGRTQKTQLTDGTRDGTVKAASTLPALTDTAVVTTQRDPLPAGTNVIGHVINDTGSTTAVTGNVAVTNAGLTNLDVALSTRTKPADQQHTIIDSGTTTVTQATGSNLHVAVDSMPSTAVTGPLTDTQLRASAVPVSGTVAVTSAGLTNLDVALSTRLKPADTLAAVTSITNAVTVAQATAANLNATVTQQTITKGTQGSTGVTTQDLKDAGRVRLSFYANAVASGTTGTETMITLTKSADQGATSTASTFVVTSGKRFRITSITLASRGNATATIQISTFALRINTAGAAIATSTPLILGGATATPATASAWDRLSLTIPDGFEILGDGTLQFGISANAVFVTNAPTWFVNIIGYEY